MQTPILLQDSTRTEVPVTLKILFDNLYKELKPTREELLMSLIYLLMLEVGFTPKSADLDNALNDGCFNIKRIISLCEHPKLWTKDNSVYEMCFVLNNIKIETLITVSSFSVGLILNIINSNIETNETEYVNSHFINTATFILNESAELLFKFNNLKRFSIELKDILIIPAKCNILFAENITYSCLQKLPWELVTNIASYLPVSDVVKLSQTCKYLNGIKFETAIESRVSEEKTRIQEMLRRKKLMLQRRSSLNTFLFNII